ncbi:hypothetical protein ACRALDRAFT_1069990 [Sodiomyces alcalophilus JCM 7366]|uniref:uncharacterized protein n=1 Tax=Sodiomyces alcalophilus JCM 7366 TaxID=591952 RepID=UPI0039B582E7
MGIKDKIKEAFHPDRDETEPTSQQAYGEEPTGSAPGAYPADRDPRMNTKQGAVDQPTGAYASGAAAPGAAAAHDGNQPPPTSRHAPREKAPEHGHRPTDSGVDFGGDNRQYQGKEPRQEGSAVRNEGAPPYWGSMGSGGRGENPAQQGGGEGFSQSQREFPFRSAERPPQQQQQQQQFQQPYEQGRGGSGFPPDTAAGVSKSGMMDPSTQQRGGPPPSAQPASGAVDPRGGGQDYDPRLMSSMKPQAQDQGYDRNVGGQKMGMMGGPIPSSVQQGTPAQAQSQARSGMGAGSGAGKRTEAAGPGHFGPGLDGSRVVHTCHACGADNDISQYFQKDAVYRMT